jgi:hypothetical protein
MKEKKDEQWGKGRPKERTGKRWKERKALILYVL